MTTPLTDIERSVLKAYDDLMRRDQWPPSCRRLAAHTGKSLSTVQVHLNRLGAKGVLKQVGSQKRWVRT